MAYAKPDSGWRVWSHKLSALSREKNDTLLLLLACTFVLLPHALHLPWWASLTCALLLFWRAVITVRGQRLPSIWLLLPLAMTTLAGIYFTTQTLFGREAGVTALVLLLTFKLLEMRARRDAFVVLFLSFFLLLTTLFYSQSIATALLIIATLALLLTAQLSFQFATIAPSLIQRLRMAGFILALAVPLTFVLFIAFPRIQGPLWGLPSDAHGGRTGLSDSMSPGNISQLAQSDDVAFHINFFDPPPTPDLRYWRGAVFDRFDGRTWTQAPQKASPPSTHNASNTASIIAPEKTRIRQKITMEASGQQWLFALETPVAAPILEDANGNNQTTLTRYHEIVAEHVINERQRYDVTSYLDDHRNDSQALNNANETDQSLAQDLILPNDYNPRTMAFATALRQRYGDNTALINAVLHFFRNENFSYTLDPPLLGKNSVDDFLFSTRAGFCEHYSSAFVVLMRAAGIPARVVTGYQGGEINPIDGVMVVRQSDAHAWAEVWLQNRGWTRIDPTAAVAPSRIHLQRHAEAPASLLGELFDLAPVQNSWWKKLMGARTDLQNRWDAISNGWTQWVLNYTPDRQKNLLQTILKAFNVQHAEQYDGRRLIWMLLTLMLALGAVALCAVMLPLLLIARKTDPLDALYSALCKRMAKNGLAKKVHEGPATFRRRLCAPDSPLSPTAKDAVARFLKLYESLRYGETTDAKTNAGNGASSAGYQFKKLKYLLSQCR
ncbi:DUF3488 domain-containing protein [Glaciimonas sp. GS1]|uniref:DUF3488 domain-containing protein n=2 Tax=Glaciimonas soli TaxID=2590999 RepID=A0A843YZ20_9BURK|nr:DUF3488 domain-containing protein [Glaciimonas soli]